MCVKERLAYIFLCVITTKCGSQRAAVKGSKNCFISRLSMAPLIIEILFWFPINIHIRCHRLSCVSGDIDFQTRWRWNAVSNLMGFISLVCNCGNWNKEVTVYSRVTSISHVTIRLREQVNQTAVWGERQAPSTHTFEDSIFNGSSKIQWQEEKKNHFTISKVFFFSHRFK